MPVTTHAASSASATIASGNASVANRIAAATSVRSARHPSTRQVLRRRRGPEEERHDGEHESGELLRKQRSLRGLGFGGPRKGRFRCLGLERHVRVARSRPGRAQALHVLVRSGGAIGCERVRRAPCALELVRDVAEAGADVFAAPLCVQAAQQRLPDRARHDQRRGSARFRVDIRAGFLRPCEEGRALREVVHARARRVLGEVRKTREHRDRRIARRTPQLRRACVPAYRARAGVPRSSSRARPEARPTPGVCAQARARLRVLKCSMSSGSPRSSGSKRCARQHPDAYRGHRDDTRGARLVRKEGELAEHAIGMDEADGGARDAAFRRAGVQDVQRVAFAAGLEDDGARFEIAVFEHARELCAIHGREDGEYRHFGERPCGGDPLLCVIHRHCPYSLRWFCPSPRTS